jgi:hypothetical protein
LRYDCAMTALAMRLRYPKRCDDDSAIRSDCAVVSGMTSIIA